MKLYITVITTNVGVMGRRENSKSIHAIMELDSAVKAWVNLIVRGRREFQ